MSEDHPILFKDNFFSYFYFFNQLIYNLFHNYYQFEMKCFPLICLKILIGAGAVLSILLSIGLLVVTIYSNIKKNDIIPSQSIPIADNALIGLYVSSVIFLLMGVGGLWGTIRKKNFLLCIYFVGVFLFFLLFLFGLLLFFIAPSTVFKGQCGNSPNTYIAKLQDLNKNAQQQLCSSACPCDLNTTRYDLKNITIPFDPQNIVENGTDKAQDCDFFKNNSNNFNTEITIMTALQSSLKCGGWCTYENFYFFKGLNQDPLPQASCYNEINNFFSKYGNLLGIVCTASFAISLMNLIFICCFCFHPTKTGTKNNFYRRMMDE